MKRILNILFLMVMAFSLSAQTTLTFEGKDRTGQDYVRLSRVSIDNDDQLWHQNIYYPDTVLVLYANGTVGIETFHETFLQMQNNPNPFDGTTDVVLSTPYDGDVTMEITDVNGHIVGTHCVRPQSGTHQFRITLSTPGTYVFTARQTGHTVSVKMVNMGNGGGKGIEYMGTVETGRAPSLQLTPKSGTRGDGHYPFRSWDRMRYTGYAMVDDTEIASETVEKRQIASEVIPLRFDIARPEVETHAASNIAATSVVLNGEVLTDNNANVTERGFIYIKNSGLWNFGTDVAAGNGSGAYSTQLTGLFPATTYHVKAYATNAVGTTYGQVETFRTMDTLPVVTTTEPSNISATTFTSGGEVLALNSTGLTARGICWNTTGAPTVADNHTTQSGGLGSFTANVTGLSCGTTYYIRAYATNSVGTAYGEEYTVTTLAPSSPEVELLTVQIYAESIVTISEVLTDNCEEVTSRGVCWSLFPNPTIFDCHTVNGNGEGSYTDTLQGLIPAMTYYLRAYAINSLGIAYGDEEIFSTPPHTFTVNDGTTTNSYVPIWGSWVDAYEKCEFVIPAQRLSDMESGVISAMTFYLSSPASGSWGAASFQVFLKEITDTILNSFSGTNNAIIVYEGPIDGTQAEMNISFNTPYTYNGGNLLVGIYNTVEGTYKNVSFYGITAENGSSVSGYNSSSLSSVTATQRGFLPKTTFHIESPSTDAELSCEIPSEIIVSHITSDAAIVHWNSDATMWLLNINGTASIVTDNPCTVTDLTPETEYTIKVCALCCNGKSEWSDEVSYTTNSALPTVTTASATLIAESSATLGGSVINSGASVVLSRGVCWSTSPNPTISDSYTIDGSGTGNFTSSLTGLSANTTYYVRAYATNSVGTAYGNEVIFATTGHPCPDATTLTDRDGNIYNTELIGNQCWMKENLRTTKYADGTPISQGSNSYSTIANWYYPNDDASNKTTYGLLYNWWAVMRDSSSSSANPSEVQGICPTGWHVPSDAEWTQLTDYVSSQSQYVCGNDNTYIAKALSSTIGWNSSTNTCAVGSTPSNNNATGFSAFPAGHYLNGSSNFGVYAPLWSATESNNYNAWRLCLSSARAQVYRDSYGKSCGCSVRCVKDVSGITTLQQPTITTASVSNITTNSAMSGGNVISDGGTTVGARGICWGTSQNPTIADNHTTDGNSTGSFTSNITGLSSSTTYYVRAYATNSVGTSYGNELSFTTTTTTSNGQPCPNASTLTDIDGNTYNTVQIGSQCWMKESLRTTKYADGTAISQGSGSSTTTAYWYYPNGDASNKPTYGLLYNWKAVMRNSSSSDSNPSGVQGICPTGWHVPSDAEWKQVEIAVGMSQSDADDTGYRGNIAAKLSGNIGWTSSSNANAAGNMSAPNRNSSGFSVLPAGRYYYNYMSFGTDVHFWNTTEYNSSKAWQHTLKHSSAGVGRSDDDKVSGYSVRCVKD